MKSIRLHAAQDLRLHDEPAPEPQAGQALLQITRVGVCGSDLHWFAEGGIGDAKLADPMILGHEFSAVALGGRYAGQRVAVDPAIPCGGCEYCLRGHPNLCPDVVFAGHGGVDGAMREVMAWDEGCFFPLPDALSDDDGVMLEPLGVAIHAVELAHLKAGMTVGVFGCGVIGLLMIQMARLCGATHILATDRLPHRVAAAKALGAHDVHLTDGKPDEKWLMAATKGRGVDVAFEAAGDQGAVEDALIAAIPGGKVILAGIPDDDRILLPAGLVRRKGLTLKLVRRMKHTYPRAINLVAQGLVDVRSLVTHHFPLAQAQQAFITAEKREGLKVMIDVAL